MKERGVMIRFEMGQRGQDEQGFWPVRVRAAHVRNADGGGRRGPRLLGTTTKSAGYYSKTAPCGAT